MNWTDELEQRSKHTVKSLKSLKEAFEIEAIYVIWLREIKRYLRAKERIVTSLMMPIFWFLVFGLGLGRAIQFTGLDVSYFSFVSPGIVVMSLLFTSIFSGVSVIWDREFGFLKEILVAPISRLSIVVSRSLGGATTAFIQGLMILAMSAILGISITPQMLLLILPLMILISLGFVGLGLTIGSLMDTTEGFQLIMNFLVMPMFFLSGSLFPLNSLPVWIRWVSLVDPVTYGVETTRYIMTGISSFDPLISLFIVIVFTVAMSIISAIAFGRRK